MQIGVGAASNTRENHAVEATDVVLSVAALCSLAAMQFL
jgi:hypothetical protein